MLERKFLDATTSTHNFTNQTMRDVYGNVGVDTVALNDCAGYTREVASAGAAVECQ